MYCDNDDYVKILQRHHNVSHNKVNRSEDSCCLNLTVSSVTNSYVLCMYAMAIGQEEGEE